MKRLLREPLVHFLLIGATLFLVYGLVGQGAGVAPGTITVTKGQIAAMVSGFTRTWQRPPTPEELDDLIQDRVREEVYCREAIALGLDKDDAIIKRRLRQKMEFIADDFVAQTEPTDAELDAYLKAHPDSFRAEPRFTFRQVYLNPERHGKNLERDAARLRDELGRRRDTIDLTRLGDPTSLQHAFDGVPLGEIAEQFGGKFATRLGELAPGRWQGPVESGYGIHLVFVEARAAGDLPQLATVRDRVRREWADAKRLDANESAYQVLLKKYSVTIERP